MVAAGTLVPCDSCGTLSAPVAITRSSPSLAAPATRAARSASAAVSNSKRGCVRLPRQSAATAGTNAVFMIGKCAISHMSVSDRTA